MRTAPEGAAQAAAAKPPLASIVPHISPRRARLPEPPCAILELDLLAIPSDQREIFWSGYAAGFIDGIDRGRELAETEAEAAWASMAATIRKVGGAFSRPFSELCDLRGEPERAKRARAHEIRVAAGRDLPCH